ncbi:ATP-binding protein [Cytophaga aurantiaca]|uniref:ATP-binding protein n=1 Tax=Cytophaga aurantiaca TaxID=29530 RepID=UPI00036773EA|nr:ATP-binding protein [Cytophaga aurantiaca]
MKWRENQVQIKLTLLLIIGIIGICSICFFGHNAFTSLRESVKEFQYPDQKIKLLSNLSDQTNNTDQFLRLYTITKQKAYIHKYNKSADSVNQLFKMYRNYISGDTFKTRQIDTIQIWWNKKLEENKELIKLNNDKPDILVISKLVDQSKDTTLYSTQIHNEKIIHDSLVIIKKIPFNNEQRRGLVSKVKKMFDKKEEVDLVVDSSENMALQLYSYTYKEQDTVFTDTLVKLEAFNKVDKAQVKNVLQEKMQHDTIVNLKRLAVIEKDFFIRNRIFNQIKNIQKQEQADALINITAIQNISNETINQIFWIFLFILFTCICLYILLIMDTYRIKRYEEKLILEKQNYQNLANNRSQFLSMMAHELRTPLQSIIGFSDLLYQQNKSAPDKTHHYSEIIKKSSTHLLQTINLLLDRSKIDSGKLELEHISFNLKVCIEDVFESLSMQAQDKKINYLHNSDLPDDLFVLSDGFRLKQILYNLLSNAIKFTENGDVRLTVSTFLDTEKYIQIRFEISDTGIGIPANKLDQLFDEYNQLSTATGRLFGGTGLGLVITKKTLALFSSEFIILSQENKGTSFSFDILFEKSPHIQEKSPHVYKHLNVSILLVDDDNYNLLYTHQLLSRYVTHVYVAGSLEETQTILEQTIPDIVLCDLYIHESMGTEIIPFVAANTKIIFMSADHDRLAQLKELNYATLAKPYSIEEILSIISDSGIRTTNATKFHDASEDIHRKSLIDKLHLLKIALQNKDYVNIESLLHQIKTAFGYLAQWDEIKQIQKIESTYSVHKNNETLYLSTTDLYKHWKTFYSS